MGGRMIQEVSNIMFEKFSTSFKQKLQGGESAEAGPAQPISGLGLAFSAIKATFGEQKSEDKPKDDASGKS
jgi:hypothetical protein